MSTRRGPPSGAPPAYRYVTRIYKRSLRPVVAATIVVTGLWCLALAVEAWRELATDQDDNFKKLAALAIAQGVLYTLAFLFQVFGMFAVASQRVRSIRIFTYLSALTTLFVVGVGLMRVITHFTFKSDLILECETLVQNGTVDSLFGFWGPESGIDVNTTDPATYCNDLWNRNSWAEILVLIMLIVLGLLFTSIAFAYYRQAIDPTSPVNSSRVPANQVRMDVFPAYNMPYDAPAYAPPPGPPPFDAKPPQYQSRDYATYGNDKDRDGKNDPFGDHAVMPPMPVHWAEERDAPASRV
ncbi:hypothetical protein ID866_9491 [Astraeus odoratus]|nr:hypothetical protein ID866_9491 [Astraeus odoratus]